MNILKRHRRWLSQIFQEEPCDFESVQNEAGFLLDELEDQGLATFFYQKAKSSAVWAQAPNFFKERLEEDYRYFQIQQLTRKSEIEKILKLFLTQGLSGYLIKGYPLSLSHYDTQAERPSQDVDIWVHPNSFENAKKILMDQGYQPRLSVGGRWATHGVGFVHQASAIPLEIDLHWRPVRSHYLNVMFDQLFGVECRFLEQGKGLAPLSERAQWVLTLLHMGFKDPEQSRLISVLDLHRLWQKMSDADKEFCHAACQKFQWIETAIGKLEESQLWFGSFAESLPLALAQDHQGVDRIKNYQKKSETGKWWADLCVLETAQQKSDFIQETFFPSSQYMASRYAVQKKWQLPFAYLKRSLSGVQKIRGKSHAFR